MRLKLFSLLKLPLLVMALAALHVAPAHADMWSYVDGQGVAHFSARQLDERYELFFRGGESFNAGRGEGIIAKVGKGAATASPKLLAYFEGSTGYKAVRHLLREASATHGIDYELLLIPPTAARYGVRSDKNSPAETKLTDPKTNIRAGSSYLSYLINLFPGRIELAIAAYNAGEGAVQRAGNKIPNYPETKNYVKTVMQLYSHLKPASPARSSSGSSGRVRMEMMGGTMGRSNMVPSIVASTRLPEDTAGLN
jgi:hypothetical protein